jgi:hypothetical protein
MSTPPSPPSLLLDAVLAILRPLVRLLVRHGVTYTMLAAALKRPFLDAAHAELKAANKPTTDSAVSLLSGVHRRDVRNLTRLAATAARPAREPVSVASQVIGRWMSDPRFLDHNEAAVKLPKSGSETSFDALAAAVSNDVRPRAVLDALIRLGVVRETEGEVELLADGFVPREGFAEMTQFFRDNLADHAAAASANLNDDQEFLEQAIFVDEISQASADKLHKLAAQLWRQGFRTMMREAQARVDYDATHTPAAQRNHRARYGSYFYSADDE